MYNKIEPIIPVGNVYRSWWLYAMFRFSGGLPDHLDAILTWAGVQASQAIWSTSQNKKILILLLHHLPVELCTTHPSGEIASTIYCRFSHFTPVTHCTSHPVPVYCSTTFGVVHIASDTTAQVCNHANCYRDGGRNIVELDFFLNFLATLNV